MGGGLMQLVAYGAQDIYLTGNPQITFFKVVYRRHTNFAMESIEQTFNGVPGWGKRVNATVSRVGDLMSRVYLQVTLPEVVAPSDCSGGFRWVNYIGHAMIKDVSVEIGGQRIDRHYGDWLNIWNELTLPAGHQTGYDSMVGNTIALTGTGLKRTEATTLYIPLLFWFCRNPGLALPLIALQYHEVKFHIEFRNKIELFLAHGANINNQNRPTVSNSSNCCCPGQPEIGDFDAALYIDYIYLDTDERRRFAQVSHEYLIEQLQFTGDEAVTSQFHKIPMNFNHPCKEIIWVTQRDDVVACGVSQWNNYTDEIDNDSSCCLDPCAFPWSRAAINTNVESGWSRLSFPYVGIAGDCCTSSQVCSLLGNGHNFPAGFGPGEDGCPSSTPQHFGHWNAATDGADHAGLAPLNAGRNPTRLATIMLNGMARFRERAGSYFNLVQPFQHHTNVPAVGINVYSFALQPEEHQPSGTCNFSRIDSGDLHIHYTAKTCLGARTRVYATNYNVLRIMSGMAGIAYSN